MIGREDDPAPAARQIFAAQRAVAVEDSEKKPEEDSKSGEISEVQRATDSIARQRHFFHRLRPRTAGGAAAAAAAVGGADFVLPRARAHLALCAFGEHD